MIGIAAHRKFLNNDFSKLNSGIQSRPFLKENHET